MSELRYSGRPEVSIRSIVTAIQYGYTAKAIKSPVGPKMLRITDIQEGSVNWETVPHCFIDATEIDKFRLMPGDLVFARTGATVGKSFLIREEVPKAVFASYLIRLRFREGVLPAYIALFFQSQEYWRQIAAGSLGIGQPNVNAATLGRVTLRLPSTQEQELIVAAIEEQFSRLDAGVAALRRAQRSLRLMQDAILDRPFAATPLSAWEPLTSVGSIVTGNTPSTTDPGNYGGDIPFVTPSDFDHGDQIVFAKRFLSSVGVKNARTVLPTGSVLATCIGATLGKVALADRSCAVNQQINAVVPGSRILSKYLFYCLSRPSFTKLMWRESSSTTMPILNKSRFSALRIPVMSIPEQERTIKEISERMSFIERLSGEIARVEAKVNKMRSAILAAAFSGRLVQQDPSYDRRPTLLS